MPLSDWLGRLPDDPDGLPPWLDDGLGLADGDIAALATTIKDCSWRHLTDDLPRAADYARALVALGERHGEPNAQALGEMALGDALRLHGHIEEGMALLDRAADRFEAAGNEVGWARTRIGWLGNLYALPNAPHGGPTVERAAAIFERGGHWHWYALLCYNYAEHLRTTSHPSEALVWARRQLDATMRLDGDARTVLHLRALNSLLMGYTTLGVLDEAERYRAELIALVDHPAILPDLRAEALITIGRSHVNFGQYAQALAYLNRAAPDVRSANTRSHYLDIMAVTELWLNRLERSERHFRELIALHEGHRGSEVNLSYARVTLARLLRRRGAREEALDQLLAPELDDERQTKGFWSLVRLTQLLLLAHELGRPEVKAMALERIKQWDQWENYAFATAEAHLAIARTSADEATQSAAIERALAAGEGVPWFRWRVYRTQASLAPTVEGRVCALEAAAADLDTTQSALSTSIHADFLQESEQIYHDLALAYLEVGDVARAWQSIERGKSRLLLNARLRREGGGEEAPSASHAELEALARRHLALLSSEQQGNQLAEEIREVERRLRDLHEARDVAAASSRGLAPHGAVAAPVAPPGRALVGYFLVGEETHAFVHDGARYHHRRLPRSPGELKQLVGGLNIQLLMFRTLPRAFHAESLQRVHLVLERLADALLRPLLPLLPGEALTVVPFGDLHQLPFHLLRLDGEYLLERFDLRVVPTAERALPDGAAPGGRARHLVATNSAGGELPHTAREGERVAALLGGEAELLIEGAATRGALLGRLVGELGVVHLAAHGQLRPDQPLLSHIQLADGQLTIGDLLARTVDASLVTLSACETARAALRPGDDPMSMGRAFLAAGARSLLGSLWLLDDEAALDLMEGYYARLAAGETKAAALRALWREWIAHPEPHKRHPFYWGALQLVGDGGPL